MDVLYSIELQDISSLVFLVRSPIPSISYKIKIDISKNANNNTKIYVLNDLQWSLLIEEPYKEIPNHLNNNNQRQLKINEIMNNIFKLLCQ